MQKVILYYKFVDISDTETLKFWQRNLCERFNLRGRIIVSEQGINGTLGGHIDDVKSYVKEMNTHTKFKGIDYKWSDGTGDEFPRLSVKIKPELVAFKSPEEVKVDKSGVVGGGVHLKPREVHELIEERGDEVVFFDGRNRYEAQAGKFKKAVVPDTETTRDFLSELDSGKYDHLKDRPIITYCTGGVRCEILSVLMKNRGFKEVYQIDGGIVRYGEEYSDDGYWEGTLYVFDDRMIQRFSDKAKDIGECTHCGGNTSNYENCANKACNKLVMICESCYEQDTCSQQCSAALQRL